MLALASLSLVAACRASRPVVASPQAPRVAETPSALERDANTATSADASRETPHPTRESVVRGLLAPPDLNGDRMECLSTEQDGPGPRHLTPHDEAHPTLRVRVSSGDEPVHVWARSEAAVGLLFIPDAHPDDGAFCVVGEGTEVTQQLDVPGAPGMTEAWRVYAFSPLGARAPFVAGTREGPGIPDTRPEPVAPPAPDEVRARLAFEPRAAAQCGRRDSVSVEEETCYAVHLELSGAITRDVLMPDTVPLMGYVLGGWRTPTTRRSGGFDVFRDGAGTRMISVDPAPGGLRVTDSFASETPYAGSDSRRTTRVAIPAGLRVWPDPRGVIAPRAANPGAPAPTPPEHTDSRARGDAGLSSSR